MKISRAYTAGAIIFVLAIGLLFYLDYVTPDLDISQNQPKEMIVDSTAAVDSLALRYDPFSDESIKNMSQRELRIHLQVLESYRISFPEKEPELDSLISRLQKRINIQGFY